MKTIKELSPHVRAALEQADKCTSCGLCKDVCPVFALTLREAESPRGKNNLFLSLLRKELYPSRETVDIFNRCLLCYACQDACPAGVETERIWIAAREELADRVGRPLSKSLLLKQVLTRKGLLEFALKVGHRLPGSEESIKLNHRLFPRPAGDRLDRLLPAILDARGDQVGTVAFFPGCLLTEVFPRIGLKAAEILSFLGFRVITPPERECCGAPAFNNGDFSTARKLARRNMSIFAEMGVDDIISPDATCGGAFLHEYETLFPAGSSVRNTYLEFRKKVRDFGEFILNALSHNKLTNFEPLDRRITIHDSCHLNFLQKKKDVPREVLSLIPGLQIIESPQSDICCGFGGSYSVQFPGESRAIARRKLDNLQSTNGETIVVGSPGCLWRLRSEAAERALNIRIVHYLEILWDSLFGTESRENAAIQTANLKHDQQEKPFEGKGE